MAPRRPAETQSGEREPAGRKKRNRKNKKSGAQRRDAAKAALRSRLLLRPKPKVRPGPGGCPPQPSSRPSSSSAGPAAPGAVRPSRPLLFRAAGEEKCEFCRKDFSQALPFAPAPEGASEARLEWSLCSGCCPTFALIEAAQSGTELERSFIRRAVAVLNTRLAVARVRPDRGLPDPERISLQWEERPSSRPRRANPYA